MSAIVDPKARTELDGLRRYNTRIKVVIHSHNHKEPIDISDDVFNASVGKNIKGMGKANITVVARLNYMNMIFPNDYINIYFDIGDGQGWTRTFFGLVDRLEEEYKVDGQGTPTTMYHIIASDFMKVFTMTNVYFNPHLFDRKDVRGEDFNAFNIGGVALMTRGVFARGGPADCVLNQILVQIGFGAQWRLPDSYQPYIADRFAKQRTEYAKGRLLSSLENLLTPEQQEKLRAVVDGEGLAAYRRNEEGQLTNQLRENAGEDLDSEDVSARTNAALRASGLETNDLSSGELQALRNASDVSDMASVLSSPRIRQQLLGTGLGDESSFAAAQLAQYASVERSAAENRTIVDIMNLFDFVERRAMDGFAFDVSVWEKQGPLFNILKSLSNEVVNELFFDLRPMTKPPDNEDPNVHLSGGTAWDRTGDELRGNLQDDTNSTDGIRYMPSLVMREYPFSTLEKLDATDVPLRLRRSGEEVGNLGMLYFGGIFSNLPNAPGRHLVSSPILAIEERVEGLQPNAKTYKCLDVAVVHEDELRSSRLGRSDTDHFNVFEMYSDNVLGSDHRYFMYDFLPIITPIHVMRHGLRVRTVSTRFNRYAPMMANRTQPQPEAEEPQDAEEAPTDFPTNDLVPPLGSHSSVRFRNRGAGKYGYRYRDLTTKIANDIVEARGTDKLANRVARGRQKNLWRFHAGIDIYGEGPDAPRSQQGLGNSEGPVDVVSIADGYVVGVFPQGCLDFYGNYVVVYHPQFEAPEGAATGPKGRAVFSAYAHLGSIEPRIKNLIGDARRPSRCAHKDYFGFGRATFEPLQVRAGDKLGTLGRTAGRSQGRGDRNKLFNQGGSHLHFEINFKNPPKSDATGTVDYPTPGNPISTALPELGLAAGPSDPVRGPAPTNENPNGMDPVQFFADRGRDLVAEINALGSGVEDPDDDADGQDDAVDSEEDEPSPSRVDQGETEPDEVQSARESGTQTRGHIDTQDSRQQLGRWALLQDHWYQHNLEYVSGQISMRPAPEIRVGYRLDIYERRMSFYVESVNHTWNFPNEMTTTLQVTRGQPNNPFPAYALPPLKGFSSPESARRATSRLAEYFIVPDPIAVRRAIALRQSRPANTPDHPSATGSFGYNNVDNPDNFETYAEGREGLRGASSKDFGTTADDLRQSVEETGETEETLRNILEESGLSEAGDYTYTEGDMLAAVSDSGTGLDGTLGVDDV